MIVAGEGAEEVLRHEEADVTADEEPSLLSTAEQSREILHVWSYFFEIFETLSRQVS